MRESYPRPQYQRSNWLNLNGEWQFEFDPQNLGLKEKYFLGEHAFSQRIQVPFAYQSKLSGLSSAEESEIIWYQRTFTLDELTDVCLLHFGAVDYETDVYVNQQHIGQHIGGHTSFQMDISHAVQEGENVLTLRVRDYEDREWIPRGKQYWRPHSESIWYTRTSGIWQTVWLEQVNAHYLARVKMTPDLDRQCLDLVAYLNEFGPSLELGVRIEFAGQLVAQSRSQFIQEELALSFDVLGKKIMHTNAHHAGLTWSPEQPNLFDIYFTLYDNGDVVDEVTSYFGMRKIHSHNGQIYLNNRPYYQKLVLDQGYWPESLLTAPTDDALAEDIRLAKAMGFNGARKHQKVEDPLYLHYADKLGFLVWGESASPANFDPRSLNLIVNEWEEIVTRDYNHPSIVAWTPANESWGFSEVNYDQQQQMVIMNLYYYVKALDLSRLVVVNDGWEMMKSDIIGIHNYVHGNADETEIYEQYIQDIASTEALITATPARRNIIVEGFEYEGQPLMLTEFGGIAFNPEEAADDAWGYSQADTAESFLADYERLIAAIKQSSALKGYCYTQLTDVEQETNGLLTYDRQIKADLAKIKAINDQI